MLKLEITLDPINGNTVPDGKALEYAENLVEDYKLEKNNPEVVVRKISIGSQVMALAIFLQTSKDKLPIEDVVYFHNGRYLPVNKYGQYEGRIEGLFDHSVNFAMEIAKNSFKIPETAKG